MNPLWAAYKGFILMNFELFLVFGKQNEKQNGNRMNPLWAAHK
jgi:hypothetical protein